MNLTIGMATFDDFDGVYFSVQALRLYHPPCEIIVVDNAPHLPARKMLEPFCAMTGARYIAMPEPVGTSAPRNRVVAEATGEIVVCMDSHVLLMPGAVQSLIDFYDAHPDSQDLLSGPLVFDDLHSCATHLDDVWRGGMRGIWGQAWACQCGWQFASIQDDRLKTCEYRELSTGTPAIACPRCTAVLPLIPFPGSVPVLEGLGYTRLPNGKPFEVPGQGLGLFACKKNAWLGFNAHFRGFGGEELYIHEKFRQAGRKNLILPGLRWVHRFGRPRTPYPASNHDKIRNYVLGHRELGFNTAPIQAHFATILTADEWSSLLNEPLTARPIRPPTRPMPPADSAPEAIKDWCVKVPRDLNQHLETLWNLAAQCDHATEFSGRRESTVGLLAAKQLVSHNTEPDALLDELADRFGITLDELDSTRVTEIAPTDLLFLDSSPHTAARVTEELGKFAPAVRRFIALHDTKIFGPTGEDGQAGLWTAIEEFLTANPEWFIHSHTDAQYGLTVLGKLAADKPAQPVHFKPVGKGPGTELKAILKTLGIAEKTGCDCNAKAEQMDRWGVDGCRQHFETIVNWMRAGQEKWGWKDKLAAAAKAVTSGLVFKLDWSDPFPGLITEAIRRAGV